MAASSNRPARLLAACSGALILKEPLPPRRIVGALAMLLGLAVIGVEALRTMGAPGCAAICCSSPPAVFLRCSACCCGCGGFGDAGGRGNQRLSLVGLPLLLFEFDNLWRPDVRKMLQAVVQVVFAGAGAGLSVDPRRHAARRGRAGLFPALVPPFTLLIGYLTLGEVPGVSLFVGLAIVSTAFG